MADATCIRFYMWSNDLSQEQIDAVVEDMCTVLVKHDLGVGPEDEMRSLVTLNPHDCDTWPEDEDDFLTWITDGGRAAVIAIPASEERKAAALESEAGES